MRPRSPDKELGPGFRFKSIHQLERLYDTVKSKKSTIFRDNDFVPSSEDTFSSKAKEFNKILTAHTLKTTNSTNKSGGFGGTS
jgi:hypothetical protein